jgi:hypothetical protein
MARVQSRIVVFPSLLIAAFGCHHDAAQGEQARHAKTPRTHVDAGATPRMQASDAGAKPRAHVADAAMGRADAASSDASGAAIDTDTVSDSGPVRDFCGAVDALGGFVGIEDLVFDAATQAIVPFKPNPGATPLGSPLDGPRYDATRMPWIERDDCADFYCSADTNAYRSEGLGAKQSHYVVLFPQPYAIGEDGTGVGGFAALSNEDAVDLRHEVNAASGGEHVMLAVLVMPNDRIDLQLGAMDRWAPEAAAWSLVTNWSPNYDEGYWLDDKVSRQAIERGLALHVPIFIVDKGMPGFLSTRYSDPVDVGRVANKYPDARFIVRHAAFEHGLGTNETSDPDPMNPDADLGWGKGVGQWPEGPYDEDDADVQTKYPLTRGVNSLIKSLRDNDIGPNTKNVYVSLDEVWAHLITRPIEAAHVIGKLMKYVGEDQILFGTGSMYYGKPDPQVRKFRDFEIPDEMQVLYGYPSLTVARKAKILALNAAHLFCPPSR